MEVNVSNKHLFNTLDSEWSNASECWLNGFLSGDAEYTSSGN